MIVPSADERDITGACQSRVRAHPRRSRPLTATDRGRRAAGLRTPLRRSARDGALTSHHRLYSFTARLSESRPPPARGGPLGSSVFGRADDLRPSTPSTQGSDPSHSENAPVYRDQLRPEGRLLLRQTLSAHLSPELGGADPHRRPLPTRTPRRPRCPRSRNPKAARGGRTCCLQNLLQPLRSSPLEMSRAVCRA